MSEALRMSNIVKRFGSLTALDNAELIVNKGEIHSLLGENGAGKTTLMKILYGIHPKDEGEICLNGTPCQINSPKEAINAGISMVFQHFMLVDNLSVMENIILGKEETKWGILSYKKSREKVMELSHKLGLKVRPDMLVEDIPVGEKQRVEIIKALYRGAETIILDEPTAVLTPPEVAELFEMLKALKNEGKTIIIITHKLKETLAIADNVTVLRNGKNMGTISTKKATPEILAQMMVGRSVILQAVKEPTVKGPVVLEAKDLCLQDALKNINFTLKKGEILGVAGVEGNGQTELLEALTGLVTPDMGSIYLKGEDITKHSVKQRIREGIGFIPEDRNDRGIVPSFCNWQNAILGYQSNYQNRGVLDFKKINAVSKEILDTYQVKTEGIAAKTASLSGGNAQKLLLGRVFYHDSDVLVIAHPTRGVDVGAIEYLHKEILNMAKRGKAILLVSADLDEIRQLSDRIVVLYEGSRVYGTPALSTTEKELGMYMAGAFNKDESKVVGL
ncbi:MAG: ABC transporter ATP-binding protein [Firmicutes bacterium]|nr:ABC transporter ATP-binding protein [Bacillota bacterium]